MKTLAYVGIALAVYFFVPFIFGSIYYCIKSAASPTPLETFPIWNTLTHIFTAIFFILFCFTEYMWALYTAIGLYVVKLLTMCFLTKEMSYAKNARSEANTQNFIQQLRQTRPYISIYIRCWHVEVYYTTETSTDSEGHRHTRQVRHEREVTTYTETRHVQITGWYDQTPPLILSQQYRTGKAVSLELYKSIGFYQNSGAILQRMENDAYNQNRNRDQHCSVSTTKDIPGITQYNYLCEFLPFYMSMWFLMLALLLMFDAPLILCIRAKTPHCKLAVSKVINLQPINRQQYSTPQNPQSVQMQVQQPVQADQIQPPSYAATPDAIEPPVEMYENTMPLFVDNQQQIQPPAELQVAMTAI